MVNVSFILSLLLLLSPHALAASDRRSTNSNLKQITREEIVQRGPPLWTMPDVEAPVGAGEELKPKVERRAKKDRRKGAKASVSAYPTCREVGRERLRGWASYRGWETDAVPVGQPAQ
ncbi:hypothetical protein P7C73_g2951, partial [Tremellales sp. Uapishka_1]